MLSRSLLFGMITCSLSWDMTAKSAPTTIVLKNTGAAPFEAIVHYKNPVPKRKSGTIAPRQTWEDSSSYATPTAIDLYHSSNIEDTTKIIPAEQITLGAVNTWEVTASAGNRGRYFITYKKR